MSTSSSCFTVVIPYYQTTPDPLKRAITSVLSQKGVDRPHVLIVDDGSPLPARDVISEFSHEESACIRIIRQPNSGAAKARNIGLDNLPESTVFVAFLDSDDEWDPYHLFNARRLLDNGYDFYFADHRRSEWDKSKFGQIDLSLQPHKKLDTGTDDYEYIGDILLPIMRDHMIQTSSVVYRKAELADIRFPVDLVLGEDEVFWVKAVRRARKICFSTKIEVHMGKGVNISQGEEWGDLRSFQLMAQNIRYWKRIDDILPGEPQLKELQRFRVGQLRRNLVASILFRLRRRMSLPMQHVLSFTIDDPAWILFLPLVLIRHFSGLEKSSL
jgi:succinoglycan biosynthesis protein ExoW